MKPGTGTAMPPRHQYAPTQLDEHRSHDGVDPSAPAYGLPQHESEWARWSDDPLYEHPSDRLSMTMQKSEVGLGREASDDACS